MSHTFRMDRPNTSESDDQTKNHCTALTSLKLFFVSQTFPKTTILFNGKKKALKEFQKEFFFPKMRTATARHRKVVGCVEGGSKTATGTRQEFYLTLLWWGPCGSCACVCQREKKGPSYYILPLLPFPPFFNYSFCLPLSGTMPWRFGGKSMDTNSTQRNGGG